MPSARPSLSVGEFFTPEPWAKWAIKRFSIYESWRAGASVCDPTAGQGIFLLQLIKQAKDDGALSEELLGRLKGFEVRPENVQAFHQIFKALVGRSAPPALLETRDIFSVATGGYDILIGNPPWVNFSDLPTSLKEQTKKIFIKLNLATNARALLLGSSRMDLSGAVVIHCLKTLLKKNGKAYFYLPLSLFFNDGANSNFRRELSEQAKITSIYDLTTAGVFPGVSTRYCCAGFQNSYQSNSPVRFYEHGSEENQIGFVEPVDKKGGPFCVMAAGDTFSNFEKLAFAEKPRQGANTCGANRELIFSDFDWEPAAASIRVRNEQGEFKLPAQFLFPLITKEHFSIDEKTPRKLILLVYNKRTGKPLTEAEVSDERSLRDYLSLVANKLQQRKGTLINAHIQRGLYWALLGVGPYSFAPYKVMWEAFGASSMNCTIRSSYSGQAWQGNQALHAFLPCKSLREAKRVKAFLESKSTAKFLGSFRSEGAKGWAQPGKVARLLHLP